MKLHKYEDDFKSLISVVAADKHLPEKAIERDYYIVLLLKNLADSTIANKCVFKGGTSLSKCYLDSIERFSEDIDLTYLGIDESDKTCDKTIKKIEKIMTCDAQTEKIDSERSNRSKSMYVWFGDKSNKIKLEIGSSIRPDPYSVKTLKSYIQEFLEEHNGFDDIEKFGLKEVSLNVLNIERTFVDKLMSVKRHAICGTLDQKVRHIYDVTRLFDMAEIKSFLADKNELKRLITITKNTNSFYLKKRNISKEYDPTGPYDFNAWEHTLGSSIRYKYENLHKDLLYTDQKQSFEKAIETFSNIDLLLKALGE